MSEEYIKEILIALINNGEIMTGTDNKMIAAQMVDTPVITSN